MKTILIVNQKGGVCKSLIADEISFALERDGIISNHIDLDQQGGALHDSNQNPDATVQVVDTPGALQKELISWIEAADFIIIPTKMTLRDQEPLIRMIEIMEPYKGIKPVLYVMNCWNRHNTSRDFENWFTETYPDFKTCNLSQSELFNHAAAAGESVVKFKKSSVVARQIEDIYAVVRYELGLKSNRN